MKDRKLFVERFAQQLMKQQLKVAVAESCTGGLLAQEFTSYAGSSKWFECGFVTYSNASKIKCLGVHGDTIEARGAVSAQVAEQMAIGALVRSQANISAAITGIAGPEGGTAEKPVGTVYIATAVENRETKSMLYLFEGTRQEIRQMSVEKAISQLIERLNE